MMISPHWGAAAPANSSSRPVPLRTVVKCEDLSQIIELGFDELAELALWDRDVPCEIERAFCSTDFSYLPDFRVDGSAQTVVKRLLSFLSRQNWDVLITCQIVSDLVQIVGLTSKLDPDYTVRLEYIDDEACSKFHKDETDIRLMCTYVGHGTQWMRRPVGNQHKKVHELSAMQMVMLRGERPGQKGEILHRSPPLKKGEESRLLFVVDIERPEFGRK